MTSIAWHFWLSTTVANDIWVVLLLQEARGGDQHSDRDL
jgi:hypothetical protein